MQGPESTLRRHTAIWLIAIVLTVSALASLVSAQTDRSAYLIQLLSTSTAFRVRAQAALSLGGMGPSPTVTQALITALRDSEDVVRAAAAQSLGRVGDSSALSALRGLSSDSSAAVRQAATAAIASITARGSSSAPPPSGGTATAPAPSGPPRFYIGVGDPGSTVAGLDPTLLTSTRTTVVSTITPMSGVVVAPAGQSVAAARTAITAQHLHGYFLDVSITDCTTRPDGNIHAAVSVVVQDYPSHSIRSMLSGAATAGGVSGLSGQRAAIQAATAAALRSLGTALGSP